MNSKKIKKKKLKSGKQIRIILIKRRGDSVQVILLIQMQIISIYISDNLTDDFLLPYLLS